MTILLSAWVVDEPDETTKKLAHRVALKFVTNAMHKAVKSRQLKERTAKAVAEEGWIRWPPIRLAHPKRWFCGPITFTPSLPLISPPTRRLLRSEIALSNHV